MKTNIVKVGEKHAVIIPKNLQNVMRDWDAANIELQEGKLVISSQKKNQGVLMTDNWADENLLTDLSNEFL